MANQRTDTKGATVKVTLTVSPVGFNRNQLTVVRGLGYAGRVKSPTYTLVEVYQLSSLYLHHFDFYRFKDPAEWIDAGFREVFGDDNVCLVEWPEKAGAELPSADLELFLEHHETGRMARLIAHTAAGIQCLRGFIG